MDDFDPVDEWYAARLLPMDEPERCPLLSNPPWWMLYSFGAVAAAIAVAAGILIGSC